jgi:hypothetical protein
VNFNAGNSPYGGVSADFNGDGKADYAVANSDGNVSVFAGNGAGSFAPVSTVSVGSTPVALTSKDFNGDGKADIAVANAYTAISLLTGNGNGTFNSPVATLVGNGPHSLAGADFNGDGKADLATAINDAHNVSVLLSCQAVGIKEMQTAEQKIFVFPNPSQGTIHVNGIIGETKVSLYDIFGNCLHTDLVLDDKGIIDLNAKPPGIYFLQLNMGGEKKRNKIVLE